MKGRYSDSLVSPVATSQQTRFSKSCLAQCLFYSASLQRTSSLFLCKAGRFRANEESVRRVDIAPRRLHEMVRKKHDNNAYRGSSRNTGAEKTIDDEARGKTRQPVTTKDMRSEQARHLRHRKATHNSIKLRREC